MVVSRFALTLRFRRVTIAVEVFRGFNDKGLLCLHVVFEAFLVHFHGSVNGVELATNFAGKLLFSRFYRENPFYQVDVVLVNVVLLLLPDVPFFRPAFAQMGPLQTPASLRTRRPSVLAIIQ